MTNDHGSCLMTRLILFSSEAVYKIFEARKFFNIPDGHTPVRMCCRSETLAETPAPDFLFFVPARGRNTHVVGYAHRRGNRGRATARVGPENYRRGSFLHLSGPELRSKSAPLSIEHSIALTLISLTIISLAAPQVCLACTPQPRRLNAICAMAAVLAWLPELVELQEDVEVLHSTGGAGNRLKRKNSG